MVSAPRSLPWHKSCGVRGERLAAAASAAALGPVSRPGLVKDRRGAPVWHLPEANEWRVAFVQLKKK